ncbi:MAG TPA: hypothetical protein PLN71_09745 [Anaerolineae bacterium]|nr:hypothetical protein [Anaerolineae bacterium]
MGAGTIQKTIKLFKAALEGLHADIPLLKLEGLAIMVHKAMTMQGRYFHTPEHIFTLFETFDPIQALAALYHDIVYYQVDEGLTPEVHALIAPYLREKEGRLFLVAHADPTDAAFARTLEVFAFEPGQPLSPVQGQNEFLSALTMNVSLEGIVSAKDLLKATACIEATIPFRGLSAQGESPADVLERRLTAINARHGFGMDTEEIARAVEVAVILSNHDVASFAEKDTALFLDGTWKLLPEMNPSLRLKGIYTIRNYRQALQKMANFLNTLNPKVIFNRYRDVPPVAEFDEMVRLAHQNVYTARDYLAIKLLTVAILEALAELSGGDAPMALFMGDIESEGQDHLLEDFLPFPVSHSPGEDSSPIFRLLMYGRAGKSSFDMNKSPLSLFIYQRLGMENCKRLLQAATSLFNGQLAPQSFLDQFPTEVIVPIATACAVMATTRSVALRHYLAHKMPTH